MTTRRSAGILLYRFRETGIEVLIGHMGGPYWARKDARAWSIPKGEYTEGEEPLDAARREFMEEMGAPVPSEALVPLGEVKQAGGKITTAWAGEGDLDPASAVSISFEMEWPRGSGRIRSFPEVDRVEWVSVDVARDKLVAAQVAFLDRLLERLES